MRTAYSILGAVDEVPAYRGFLSQLTHLYPVDVSGARFNYASD